MHRQNAEEREAERHAANRLLMSLQTGAAEHPIKALGAHNALAAAASLAHQTAANLFNPTAVPHPINLLSNGQTAIPHHLLSPKSTASNSSASRDQPHETDLNQLAEASSQANQQQTMQRHLNQLMHHQLLSNSQHHGLLTGASANLTTTTSTPSSTTSAPSTTPPSQFSTANSLAHHSSFNAPATSLESSTPNAASLHDFHSHPNPSINAALAALNAPGHLLNRHFSQLSHLHRLGAHYPMPTLTNGQTPGLPVGNQSLIGHHLQSNGQLIDSTTSPSLTSANGAVTTSPSTTGANPAHLYSLNQLSQLSHYAQLGFLGGNPMLQSLQMAGQRPKDERNEPENDKKTTKLTNLSGSDEEACFTEDENGEAAENMEINVASDDEDCKTESSFNNEDEKDAKVERSERSERSGRFRKGSAKKLKTADGDRKVKEEKEINIDENSKESLSDENSCSKIDELLRSKEERRKIKLKPYKLISSSNSIVGSA